MPIDPRHLLERRFEPRRHAYTLRDTALYALGVGLAADPLDEAELRFVYEGVDGQGMRALPTLVNVLAHPGFWAREPDTGIDWHRLLHAEQAFVLHRPVPAAAEVEGRTRVTALWDKGTGKGALMQSVREIVDLESGRPLASVTQLTMLRGDGGFGEGASPGAPPPPHALPERRADAVCDLPTLPRAALIYRLSGDLNPLHADPAVARAAGFERPILHGLATLGVAGHAVLKTVLDYDPARFAGMRVRFTAPVLPGDTLRTEIWVDGDTVSLRCAALERNRVVLDNGRVDLRPRG
jgi:acyl dehydratase